LPFDKWIKPSIVVMGERIEAAVRELMKKD